MNKRKVDYYFRLAQTAAEDSYAKRDQVGCVLVKNNRVIVTGYNGTVSGEDNLCECPVTGITYEHVIHAELNALLALAGSHESARNAAAFITRAPCINCAGALITAGVSEVHYINKGSGTGIDLLSRRVLLAKYPMHINIKI